MKFLIDNALSPLLANALKNNSHDAKHVRDYGMQDCDDTQIFHLAAQESRILVSADTDFGTLLALRQETKPSVILFRRSSQRLPEKQANLLLKLLPSIQEDLQRGSIVIIEEERCRVRFLPIVGDKR